MAWMWWIAARAAAPTVDVPLRLWTSNEFPDGVNFGSTYGMCAGDYNQDGWVDAYTYAGGTLWENVGGTSWVEHDLSGISTETFGYSASFADFDRDGFPELATEPRGGCVEVFDNIDGATFENVTTTVLDQAACGESETLAWADVDGDGWLDLFVPIYPYGGDVHQFYRNAGPGTDGVVRLVDESDTAGFIEPPGIVRPEGVQFLDTDDDGDADLYSNGILYVNQTAASISFDALGPGEHGIGLNDVLDEGAAFADYDLDGDFDLLVAYTNWIPGPSPPDGFVVWRSLGDGTFVAAPEAADDTPRPILLGLSVEDWDFDGDLDGHHDEPVLAERTGGDGDRALRHRHPPNEPSDIIYPTPSWVDWDHDGDLDTFLGNWASVGHLYENLLYGATTPAAEKRHVRVRVLSDDPAFPDGLETEFGAVVELRVHGDARRYRKFVASGSGYLNQNEYTLTFALPSADSVFDVSVDFLSRPENGKWRIDRLINPSLGDLTLADLADREIAVFRSGRAIVDGVDAAPEGTESPALFATASGPPAPARDAPLALVTAAPSETTWVGVSFTPSEPVRLRELLVDGEPAAPTTTCGGQTGNVLLWDETAGTLVGVSTIAAVAGNARHAAPLDGVLRAGHTYRAAVRVAAERASPVTDALTAGPATTEGGFSIDDADPCGGVAAAAADPATSWITVRYAATSAEPTVTTDTGGDTGGTTTDTDGGTTPDTGDGPSADGCGCAAGLATGGWLAPALILLVRRRRSQA